MRVSRANREQNVKKAKDEIARLEEEATAAAKTPEKRSTDTAKKPALEHQANGDAEAELKQEKDAAADVSEDLKKASLEEKA